MAESAFIRHLWRLADREDRGALAALRRGLSRPPGTAPEAFPYVAPFVPEDDSREGRDWPYYLTAALFSLHPARGAKGDVGWTCRQLGDHPSAEKRFQALLSSDREQLPGRLRQVVTLARSNKRSVPVDWSDLLVHLRHWDNPSGWVQRRWARSYWGPQRSVAGSTDS